MIRHIVFIVNPISGVRQRQKARLPKVIEQHLDASRYTYEIRETAYAGHAYDMAVQLVADGNTDIIAVAGGDGSVNEVVKAILHTTIQLAILPFGSGNGLARHLGIPMDSARMIQLLHDHAVQPMDVIRIGDALSVSNVGIGFDGYVADLFSQHKKRGFFGYVRGVIRGAMQYKGFSYSLRYNGHDLTGRAFMVTACNANQHGYNIRLAPGASLTDGLFDLYIVSDLSRWLVPFLVLLVMLRLHHRSRWFTRVQAKQLQVQTSEPAYWHIDGEPAGKDSTFALQVLPSAIQVITGHGKI